jgi:hypothetical protein
MAIPGVPVAEGSLRIDVWLEKDGRRVNMNLTITRLQPGENPFSVGVQAQGTKP